MLAGVTRLMDDACQRGVFPGAGLVVYAQDRLVHQSSHGTTSTEPPGVSVTEHTFFDLASLTKVMVVSTLSMLAVQRSELDLHKPIMQYLPDLQGKPLGEVSSANLLEHTSGLVAWAPLYRDVERDLGKEKLCTLDARNTIRDLVANQVMENQPGKKALYSDLGFILLDQLLETVYAKPLDKLFRSRVTGPLGINDLFFIDLKNPLQAERVLTGRVFAATERCSWRGKVLAGQVHDQNTWASGGVSGQAGLFGTAMSVADLCRHWLRGYNGESSIFGQETVSRFWTKSSIPGSTRTLGFDTKSPQGSQAGTLMGKSTVGHLGYTGTSVWIDPVLKLLVVLLSNRIHPSTDNELIKQFRPVVHDAIVEAVFGDTI